MRYVSWATMWHVRRSVGLTVCGRGIPAKAARRDTQPDPIFLCDMCRRSA